MASENTTVIDVIARLTDETSPRLRTIQGNMDRFGVSVERTRRQARRQNIG